MGDVIRDYVRAVDDRLPGDGAKKRRILRRLEEHLTKKVDELHPVMGGVSREQAERQVVQAFGTPDQLALVHGPGGSFLKNDSGEVVLRVGAAVGRGVKSVVKWTAISVAFLLVLAMVGGVWAFYEVKPVVERNAPYPVYSHDGSCSPTRCDGVGGPSAFFVHAGAREIRFDVQVAHETTSAGFIEVVVKDPNGNEKYRESFSGAGAQRVHKHAAWQAVVGDWTIEYKAVGFHGDFSVNILGVGLPSNA